MIRLLVLDVDRVLAALGSWQAGGGPGHTGGF